MIPRLPMIGLLLLTASLLLGAEEPLVIIVHPQSGVTLLTQQEATNIFMGRQKCFASGLVAMPMEQTQPGVRTQFYRLLLHRAPAEVSAYWARLCFSGQARPPLQAKNSEDVLAFVATHRGAIGFVEQAKLDTRVKGILVLGNQGTP